MLLRQNGKSSITSTMTLFQNRAALDTHWTYSGVPFSATLTFQIKVEFDKGKYAHWCCQAYQQIVDHKLVTKKQLLLNFTRYKRVFTHYQGAPEIIQVLPIITITPILLLIIQTARVAQSTSLLPCRWCFASQRPVQLVLREVLSTTICSTSLRRSIAIELCRELKMEPERKRQMDLNKTVLLCWKTHYSFSYTATTLRPSVLQLPRSQWMELSCSLPVLSTWVAAVNTGQNGAKFQSKLRFILSNWCSMTAEEGEGTEPFCQKRWSLILPSSEKGEVSHLAKD